jgi:hypothetical protein
MLSSCEWRRITPAHWFGDVHRFATCVEVNPLGHLLEAAALWTLPDALTIQRLGQLEHTCTSFDSSVCKAAMHGHGVLSAGPQDPAFCKWGSQRRETIAGMAHDPYSMRVGRGMHTSTTPELYATGMRYAVPDRQLK